MKTLTTILASAALLLTAASAHAASDFTLTGVSCSGGSCTGTVTVTGMEKAGTVSVGLYTSQPAYEATKAGTAGGHSVASISAPAGDSSHPVTFSAPADGAYFAAAGFNGAHATGTTGKGAKNVTISGGGGLRKMKPKKAAKSQLAKADQALQASGKKAKTTKKAKRAKPTKKQTKQARQNKPAKPVIAKRPSVDKSAQQRPRQQLKRRRQAKK